jgi:hypothetical protein
MAPNSSAIVAVVELTWVADVEREFASVGADVVREAVEQDLVAQLNAGTDVTYSAADVDGDVVAARSVVPGARAESGTPSA